MNLLHSRQFPSTASERIPLVLLHGFLGDSLEWEPLAAFLADDVPCIAIDLPGHGQSHSVRLASTDGFAACSQLLHETLLERGVDRYILLGYSLGGRIAMHHAARYPTQIAGLLVESSHPGLRAEDERMLRLASDQRWAERLRNESLDEVLNDWYRQAVFAPLSELQRAELVKKRQANCAQGLADMLLATSLAKQAFLGEILANDQFNSYYLFGEKDIKYRKLAAQLTTSYPRLIATGFPDAGHNIHLEQPVDFRNKVRDICRLLR